MRTFESEDCCLRKKNGVKNILEAIFKLLNLALTICNIKAEKLDWMCVVNER